MKNLIQMSLLSASIGLSGMSTSAHADDNGYDAANPAESLNSIDARKCGSRTTSGLGYQMLQIGKGPRPGKDAKVKVGYAGYFMSDGSKFDSSPSAQFPVGGVIKGFGEGVMLLNRGAKIRICIPYGLGYGDSGKGPIPAKSNLIFYVELLDF